MLERQQNSEELKEPSKTNSSDAQKQLKESFVAHAPLSHSTTRWKKLTEAVCYYIAKDMLPLDMVSGEWFLHMIKEFELRYNPEALPDNNTPEEQAKIELQQYIDDFIYSF